MGIQGYAKQSLHILWWVAVLNVLCAMPLHLFFGGAGDTLRLAVYAGILGTAYLISRRWPALGVLLHFVGALGLALWVALDPHGFAAQLPFGPVTYSTLSTPIVFGMGVFLGGFGIGLGVVLGGLGLGAYAMLAAATVQTLIFAALQIALAGLSSFGVHLLMQRLDRMQQALEEAALTDTLTGLGNRRALSEAFGRYSSLAARKGMPLLVSSWDVNGLKRLNDSAGHAAGDAFLQRFAATVRGVARSEDVFFRVGGDEFVGLHLGLHDAASLIERVRQGFPEVAAGWVATAGDLDATLIAADRAMYADKAGGKPKPASLVPFGLETV